MCGFCDRYRSKLNLVCYIHFTGMPSGKGMIRFISFNLFLIKYKEGNNATKTQGGQLGVEENEKDFGKKRKPNPNHETSDKPILLFKNRGGV